MALDKKRGSGKPSATLVVALGGPMKMGKKGGSSPAPSMKRQMPRSSQIDEEPLGYEDDDVGDDGEGELDPAFVDYAESAFPEMMGDEGRLHAFKEAIKACVRKGGY